MPIINGRGRVGIRKTGGAPALLLDTYSGASVAFSLRKLSTAYSGPAIRVRRSSDNTEQNIGFVSGNLDTAALAAFVGAGNGFVTTWYDQSGNGRNLVQASSTRQPQIVTSGVVSTTGIKFDGVDDRMNTTINFTQSMPTTTYGVFTNLSQSSSATQPRTIYCMSNTLLALSQINQNRLTVSSSGGSGFNFENSQILPMTYIQGAQVLDTVVYTSTLYKHSLNGGSASGTPTVAAYSANNTYFALSNYFYDPYGYPKFDIKEVVYFSGDKSSSLPAIEASVNSNYSIYPVVSDADAQKFVIAAGLTSSTQASAVNTLVTSLKSAGIWAKMKAVYPMVGGSAAAHKWNLKDPRDLDAAYRLTFAGTGWVHSSTGAKPNGTSDYARTFLNPSSNGSGFAVLSTNSTSVSFYSRTNAQGNADFGPSAWSAPYTYGYIRSMTDKTGSRMNTTNSEVQIVTTSSLGLFTFNRNSGSGVTFFRNGTPTAVSSTSTGLVSSALIISGMATNSAGTSFEYGNKECAFASIGDGLTDAEGNSLYTIVQAYQTTLGRQV